RSTEKRREVVLLLVLWSYTLVWLNCQLSPIAFTLQSKCCKMFSVVLLICHELNSYEAPPYKPLEVVQDWRKYLMIRFDSMSSFSVVFSNGIISNREISLVGVRKTSCLGRFRSLCCAISVPCCNSVSFSSLGFYRSCKSPLRLDCNSRIRSKIDGRSGNEDTHLGKSRVFDFRRRFSLRLRPRLWFLSLRLRRASIHAILNEFGMLLRKNAKKVMLSTLISISLGMCYLLIKLLALPSPKVVPYSDLIMSLRSGSVTNVLFEEGSRQIYYNMKPQSFENTRGLEVESSAKDVVSEIDFQTTEGNKVGKIYQVMGGNLFGVLSKSRSSVPKWQYSTRKIDHDENFLLSLMRAKGTTYSSAPPSPFMAMRSMLITILSLWIPLTPLLWLLYRQVSAANSPARKRRPSSKIVSFEDVEGVDGAKVELMEIVSCLQGAINYNKLRAKLPKGVLLVGPPGTGKTLLARAVAGEAGVPFFSVSASEFVELFVGRGAARIRDLFSVARKSAPSIIFIDELDAVGGKRGRSFNDERDQTLNQASISLFSDSSEEKKKFFLFNCSIFYFDAFSFWPLQLLTEMDGFDSEMKVIVIAATNRPEALDPALCRPGRFSRKVYVGEPDENGRRKILAVHLREVPLDEDLSLMCSLVASLTKGFVGADLANIVNEAALLAARRGGETVSREDIMEAIERAKYGIHDEHNSPATMGKELGKLFPWMPSLMGRNDTRQDGKQMPLGYQTLS
ncbi:Peptidase M41, FtsH extracellular, partial [Dillenia turbinata]